MISEERDDDDDDNDDDDNDDNDTETPDPVQAQIPSHPGIKYPVRGIPPSDLLHHKRREDSNTGHGVPKFTKK